MLLFDVNVLVYAHREDTENHVAYRAWLEGVINADAAYASRNSSLPGAYLAALAIASDSEWITTDRDFSGFKDRS